MAGITGKLTQGAVDAGFLYASDVRATDDKLKAIELPDALQPTVAYGVAVVKGAKQPEQAKAFIAGLLDGAGARGAGGRGLPAAADAVTGRRPGWFAALLVAALTLALLFLTIPVVAIFVDTGPLDLLDSLGEEGALDALRLSLLCSGVAVTIIVLVGTPAAYLLATRRFRGRAAIVTLIELPLVLPPAVAGIGLLAALGPQGRPRRPRRGRGPPARADDDRRDPGAHVRRGAVLPAPGAGRLRGARSNLARRLADARRRRGAHVPARGDPGAPARA